MTLAIASRRTAPWPLLLAALLAALAGAGPAAARRVEITVLHTTDLHGHVLPTRDYEGRENVGGLLRCSTLIQQLRAECPNVLLIDCGDLFQGSAESLLTHGQIMVKALGWLSYDAWILGNHEFDWGLDRLVSLHNDARIPMLCANMTARPGMEQPLPKVAPFVVRTVEGVRIAIVGLITPGVPTWSRPNLLGPELFDRSVAALQRIMPAVRAAEPDIIVLGTHQGYKPQGDDNANEIRAIASAFPEIDVIVGGHSHRVVESARLGGTLYTQAGYYGIWLGRVDLAYDTVERRLIRREASVLPVGDRYPVDAKMEVFLGKDLAVARTYLAEKIGSAGEPLPASPHDARGRSPVQMLICRAIAQATGAGVVLHGVLSEDGLAAGDLRMQDAWTIVPYENTIGVALLTPGEIMEILDENERQRGTAHYMGMFGASATVERQPDGTRRAVSLRLADGSAPHPRERIKVAMNSYLLASGGGRFRRTRELVEQPEARLTMTATDTRTAVVEYIRRHSPLRASELMKETD
jgi:5'-nucleotidase / UDP-sugar diphosphatase